MKEWNNKWMHEKSINEWMNNEWLVNDWSNYFTEWLIEGMSK